MEPSLPKGCWELLCGFGGCHRSKEAFTVGGVAGCLRVLGRTLAQLPTVGSHGFFPPKSRAALPPNTRGRKNGSLPERFSFVQTNLTLSEWDVWNRPGRGREASRWERLFGGSAPHLMSFVFFFGGVLN